MKTPEEWRKWMVGEIVSEGPEGTVGYKGGFYVVHRPRAGYKGFKQYSEALQWLKEPWAVVQAVYYAHLVMLMGVGNVPDEA